MPVEFNPTPNVPKPWRWAVTRDNGFQQLVAGFAATKREARLAMFLTLGVRNRRPIDRAVYLRTLGIDVEIPEVG